MYILGKVWWNQLFFACPEICLQQLEICCESSCKTFGPIWYRLGFKHESQIIKLNDQLGWKFWLYFQNSKCVGLAECYAKLLSGEFEEFNKCVNQCLMANDASFLTHHNGYLLLPNMSTCVWAGLTDSSGFCARSNPFKLFLHCKSEEGSLCVS